MPSGRQNSPLNLITSMKIVKTEYMSDSGNFSVDVEDGKISIWVTQEGKWVPIFYEFTKEQIAQSLKELEQIIKEI